MKKYVSAILIEVLLFQFCACYTLRDYTYDEFRTMNDITEATIIYDTESKLYLDRDSLHIEYMNWVAETDTLRIYSSYHKAPFSNTPGVILDTLILAKSQINEILVEEFSNTRLLIGIAACVGIVFLIINLIINQSGCDVEKIDLPRVPSLK
jgi:hypothetical protein